MSESGTKIYFSPNQAQNIYKRCNPDILGSTAFLGTVSIKLCRRLLSYKKVIEIRLIDSLMTLIFTTLTPCSANAHRSHYSARKVFGRPRHCIPSKRPLLAKGGDA